MTSASLFRRSSLLVALFAGYAAWKFRREFREAEHQLAQSGTQSELLRPDELTMRDKFALLPRVLPFVILLTGVLFEADVVRDILSKKVACYLEKTSSLAKILETVRDLLDHPKSPGKDRH